MMIQDEQAAQLGARKAVWQAAACPLCRQQQYRLYHEERLAYFGQELTFRIVRCVHCGLVFTNPRLRETNGAYEHAAWDAQAVEAHARAKAGVFERALNEIGKRQRQLGKQAGGCLLDIGCGSGHFAGAARQRGYAVMGLEPTASYAAYARGCHQIDVIERPMETAGLIENSFDVITAWDVIEHVSDPRLFLERCALWLKPDGILALRFPSARWQKLKGVVYHRLLGSVRAAFAPTIHLTFFDKGTFAAMASQEGLKVLGCRVTAAEANTGNSALDALKRATYGAARLLEKISGAQVGNLEVYCTKVKR